MSESAFSRLLQWSHRQQSLLWRWRDGGNGLLRRPLTDLQPRKWFSIYFLTPHWNSNNPTSTPTVTISKHPPHPPRRCLCRQSATFANLIVVRGGRKESPCSFWFFLLGPLSPPYYHDSDWDVEDEDFGIQRTKLWARIFIKHRTCTSKFTIFTIKWTYFSIEWTCFPLKIRVFQSELI